MGQERDRLSMITTKDFVARQESMVTNQFRNPTESQSENLWYKMKIENMGFDEKKYYSRPKALARFDSISFNKLKEFFNCSIDFSRSNYNDTLCHTKFVTF